MNMPTNDSKLLEKVLSKWAFDELPDNKYNKNQIAIRISEIKEMLLDMEAEARADTSKQIFNEIDEYVYVTGLSVKDKKADWFKEKYEALKKKYNIEE